MTSRESWYGRPFLVGKNTTFCKTNEQGDALRPAFAACNVQSKSLTHTMRHVGANWALGAGVTEDAIRHHGRWAATDRMNDRYIGPVALPAIRALAGFSSQGGDIWLPRDLLDPPPELCLQIFPEVERWERYLERLPANASDNAGLNFLRLLRFLRRVLLQDAAFFDRASSIFQVAPLNTPAFEEFAARLKATVATSPPPFEISVQQLAPAVHNSLVQVRAEVQQVGAVVRDTLAMQSKVLDEIHANQKAGAAFTQEQLVSVNQQCASSASSVARIARTMQSIQAWIRNFPIDNNVSTSESLSSIIICTISS